MIRLTKRSLLLSVVGAPLWLVNVPLAAVCVGFVLFLHFLDYMLLPRRSKVVINRILPQHFELDTPENIEWRVSPVKGMLRDTLLGQDFYIEVQSEITNDTFTPRQRGKFSLDAPTLTLKSPLGLLFRTYTTDTFDEIKVYPSIRQSYQTLSSKYGETGAARNHHQRNRQQGGEFESLRPYIYGEDLRNVAWKLSAKKSEMICKNWEVENDRHITVLIDCGRMMAETVGDHSLLDYSLNAVAQLTQQIQNKHDTFSLYAFSNRLVTSLPKTSNQSVTKRTLETIYRLQSEPVESDYWQVVAQVMGKLKKRSLIILFCNVIDTAGSLGLMNNLTKAAEKHLVLCVTMKDQQLEDTANSEDAYQQAAACHLLLEKKRAIKTMRHYGINVLEVSEKSYIAEIIQCYLTIREKI